MSNNDGRPRRRGEELEEFDKLIAKEGRSRGMNAKDIAPDNPWASKGWGGKPEAEWPDEFDDDFGGGGGGEGTAMLDLNDMGLGDGKGGADAIFDRPNSGRADINRFNQPRKKSGPRTAADEAFDGGGWAAENDGFDDFFGGDGGGGGGEGTAVLDLNALNLGGGGAGTERQEDIRVEDGRDALAERKRGAKSFDASVYDAGDAPDEPEDYAPPQRANYGADPGYNQRGPQHAAPPPAEASANANELEPHERTQALDLSSMNLDVPPSMGGAPPPPATNETDANMRTQAVDLDALLQGGPIPGVDHAAPGAPPPGELNADARTAAWDMPADAPPLPGGAPTMPANTSTTVVDTNDLINGPGVAAAPSDGKLVVFSEGLQQPILFPLRPGLTNIGRDPSNHLVLTDSFASRKHLRIKFINGRYEMRDNGSDNATLVNHAPSSQHLLEPGDEIIVGATVMRFIVGEPTQADYAPPQLPEDRHNEVAMFQDGVAPAAAAAPAQANTGPGGIPMWAMIVLGFFALGSLVLIAVIVVLFILP